MEKVKSGEFVSGECDTEGQRDIIERRVVLSTDFTDDEDWPSTDSISDFSHLKEVLDQRLKPASSIRTELLRDLNQDYLE